MKIRLNSEILEKIPGFTVAVLVLKNINNKRNNSMVSNLLRGALAVKKTEMKNIAKKEALQTALKHFNAGEKALTEIKLFESLIRKATKEGADFKSNNNAVDLSHFLSLKYLTPAFGQDLDLVGQDLEIGFIKTQKKKKTPDFDYTKQTQNLVFWFLDIGVQTREKFLTLPEIFANNFIKYCGGNQAEIHILNIDQPEVNLGYTSQKELDTAAELLAATNADTTPLENEISSEPEFLENSIPVIKPEPLLKDILQEELEKTVQSIKGEFNLTAEQEHLLQDIKIDYPREKNHGDYATSVALKIGKATGKNPLEVAQLIQATMRHPEFVERTEIAGQGFINFHLKTEYLAAELQKILSLGKHYGKIAIGLGQNVVIDFSSPNVAKPLGAHHLLSTIIGQVVANILQNAGYNVIKANYLGDWGTQFGKLIYAYRTWGNHDVVIQNPIDELLKLYVKFHDEAEKEPTLEDRGREEFKKLEAGDPENRKLWEWITELSKKELEKVYQQLGVSFDVYLPESMYEDKMQEIIELGKQKGVFTTGEKGALIAQFENDKYPPYIIQKADGATLYSTRDLASIKDRIYKYAPAKLVYVVDVAQSLHFQQLFATATKLGLDDAEMVHVAFGRMQLPEGSMSTRKGTVVKLEDLMIEAEKRTRAIVEEKSKELPEAEKEALIHGIAIGAIKYQILCQNRETNLVFDWDKMLAMDGNSAPYLQYSVARAESIIRKYKESLSANPTETDDSQTSLFSIDAAKKADAEREFTIYGQPSEQAILKMIVKFPEIIEAAAKSYKPNLIANYLYDLSQAFNGFYQEVQVLNTVRHDLKKSRVDLVRAFAQTMKNGLTLLGIQTFEKM